MALNRLPRQRSAQSFAKLEAGLWSPAILAATAGAFLLAGLVKGAIGLGLPTVAIGTFIAAAGLPSGNSGQATL